MKDYRELKILDTVHRWIIKNKDTKNSWTKATKRMFTAIDWPFWEPIVLENRKNLIKVIADYKGKYHTTYNYKK